jgi:hypothetical protein
LLTLALVGGERSASRFSRFIPKMTCQCPWKRKLGGSQTSSGRFGGKEEPFPPGRESNDFSAVQPMVWIFCRLSHNLLGCMSNNLFT